MTEKPESRNPNAEKCPDCGAELYQSANMPWLPAIHRAEDGEPMSSLASAKYCLERQNAALREQLARVKELEAENTRLSGIIGEIRSGGHC